MKNLLMTTIAIFGLATITMAQTIPSYVPTNGLVGYWPFNGNANDESGNGNNGTVNGAALTTDRFGNSNKAYNFDGTSNFIDISSLNNISYKPITYNLWMNLNAYNTINYPLGGGMQLIGRDWSGYYDIGCLILWDYPAASINNEISYYIGQTSALASYTPPLNSWLNITMTLSSQDTIKFYINGNLQYTQHYPTNSSVNGPFRIGAGAEPNPSIGRFHYNGKLDDVGVWNRALSQQEITDLYNGCQLSVNTQPTNQTINVNNNAQFIVGSSDPNATYQWQTDLGVGFQNLNSVGQYSGSTSTTLTVSNTTMTNNNQPFRCIISSGSCSDTSNVAVLSVINNLGIDESSQDNLFSVTPNPASDHLIIDNGNHSLMAGYSIQIKNNTGQQVFQSLINQAQFTVDLSTWTGNGLYFVHILDPQGSTVTIRKIIIQ